jgi:Anaphase-promoting complex, cyclosome, subunit 3
MSKKEYDFCRKRERIRRNDYYYNASALQERWPPFPKNIVLSLVETEMPNNSTSRIHHTRTTTISNSNAATIHNANRRIKTAKQLHSSHVHPPPTADSTDALIERIRGWRDDAINQKLYETASYWADKVYSMTGIPLIFHIVPTYLDSFPTITTGDPSDTYWLAQTYYYTQEYLRAETLITSEKLIKSSHWAKYLAAKCAVSICECCIGTLLDCGQFLV